MIQGTCILPGEYRPDLDDNDSWPTEFVSLPRIGDTIESLKGQTKVIEDICHCFYKRRVTKGGMYPITEEEIPYIKVFLGPRRTRA